MISVRTNYASVPDGGLDPLWLPDGRHTAGRGYIGAEKDPLGGNFRVQRHTVHDGDMFSGGERCEVMSGRIPASNKRFQLGFGLMLPPDFATDGNTWNSLWDLHYPNAGPKQSPITCYVNNGTELHARILSGPLTSDGTMGQDRKEAFLCTLKKGVYQNLCWDILLSNQMGVFDCWVDGVQVANWDFPTYSGNWDTYWKQGFYRSPSAAGTDSYFFKDTVVWFNQTPDEMLSYYAVAPPPSVAELRKIAETASTVTLEWSPVANAYGYRFFADGKAQSVTFDPSRSTVKFSKGAAEYTVLALSSGKLMSYRP